MELDIWLSFCAVALLATATPGPAALLVSVHSLSFGFRMSLVTILGNVTALFIMSGVSIAGLTAIVLLSTTAFTLIKTLGAVYLIYVGLKLWKSGIRVNSDQNRLADKTSVISLYTQGLLVALTNPKAIIFTTALFPQFIAVSEPLLFQFSLLVASFMALSLTCLSTYAFLASKTQLEFSKNYSGGYLGKVLGSTFIGVGCYLATISR